MRTLIAASLMMLMILSIVRAQEIKPLDKPQTNIEKFLLKRGALFRKNFYDIGEVGFKGNATLTIKCVEILNVNENTKITGVIFKLTMIEKYSSNTVSAYIDLETLDEFISALEEINAKADEMKTANIEYTEIYFRTNNDVMIGFYQSGIDQGGFIRLNDWQSDAQGFCGLNRFPEILDHLRIAQEKLQAL